MMDCAHYRRALLANPLDDSPSMREHLATCQQCPEYTEQLRRFEGRLERALRVRVDAMSRENPRISPLREVRLSAARPPRVRRRWLAAAASVLLAVGVAGTLWLVAPGSSLAADVVKHMADEPDAWVRTDVAVVQPKLEAVLSESQVRLRSNAGLVSYANSCQFRGHRVPHLVVQTATGPVTVMILTHEPSKAPIRFDDHDYHGVIMPLKDHGSLALLERGSTFDASTVEAVAARVQGALDWEK